MMTKDTNLDGVIDIDEMLANGQDVDPMVNDNQELDDAPPEDNADGVDTDPGEVVELEMEEGIIYIGHGDEVAEVKATGQFLQAIGVIIRDKGPANGIVYAIGTVSGAIGRKLDMMVVKPTDK